MQLIYGLFDSIIKFIKNKLTVEKFKTLEESSAKSTESFSLISLSVIIISAGVLYSKFESEEIFKTAAMGVLALTVFGYISQKFLVGCENISENHKLKVSLSAYSDLGGLAFGSLTVVAFGMVLLSFANEQYEQGAMMFVCGMLLYMTTWLLVNPKLIGLQVDKSTSLAQEAISLLLLPTKVILRSLKVLTSWILMLGNLSILFGTVMALPQEGYEAMQYVALVTTGYLAVGTAMVLPLMGYFGYMLISLVVDALRNILLIGHISNVLEEQFQVSKVSSPEGTSTPEVSSDTTDVTEEVDTDEKDSKPEIDG